jgi:iron(III) transport system ATP-binding protein
MAMAPEDLRRPQWGQRGTAGASFAASLTFDDVRHTYASGGPILNGVSLEVEPGEILCLLGRSGCGKSTLLRIAAGVERQTHGRVLLDGREIAGPSTFLQPEQRGVGLMFQDYALFPHMTIVENVMYGLRALARQDAEVAAKRALRRVGMLDYAPDYPHALSGGEQQRVALARAIAPRPPVLLMDEPFSNLDKRMRDEVRDETIAVLREARATTIVVTHDPEEAMRMADRIALMRAGRLVQVGRPEELYRQPTDLLTARFFSEMSEIPGRIRGGRVETPVGWFDAPGLPDGPGVVCVRPQAVRLKSAGLCIPGRVLRRLFLGEVDLVEIVVAGVERPIKARPREHIAYRAGDEIGIDVDPAETLVFAASDP